MKELTRRQSEMLTHLVRLYASEQQPVHYLDLAPAMRVRRTSAYEMVQTLEKAGWVQTERFRPEETRGPGRSMLYVLPTSKAIRYVEDQEQKPASSADEEWQALNDLVLAQPAPAPAGGVQAYQDLLDELVDSLPKRESPMAFVGQTGAALLVALRTRLQEDEPQHYGQVLKKQDTSSPSGLCAMLGIALGGLVGKEGGRPVGETLAPYMKELEALVLMLGAAHLQLLSGFLGRVVSLLYV